MINIVYLPHRRPEFSDLTFKILSKCKNNNFHISVCGFHNGETPHTSNVAKRLANDARKMGLSADPLIVNAHPRDNYLEKLKAAARLDFKHCMKLDEDVFLSPDTFDFMFENVTRLTGPNLILLPTLSNGVPTCDDFIEHQLNDTQTKQLHQAFSRSKVLPNLWSYNWSHINRVLASGYEKNKFYAEVAKINRHYKGIHPIRYDVKSQNLMNNFVIQNIERFSQKRQLAIKSMTAPYFCNSCFIIKTEDWRRVLASKNLYVDPFDEVTLNRYREIHKKNFLYIPNCFGIHIMYALVANKVGKQAEINYFKRLAPLIEKQL